MNEIYTLLLRLEGPMQSWGYGSYKKDRNTKLYPTQSAVTGMICRASGKYTSKIGQEATTLFSLFLKTKGTPTLILT